MKAAAAILSLILTLTFSDLPGLSAEKLKVGSATKSSPWYYLPILAGQDAGFWKENGIEAEWVPFRSGSEMYRAVAAGAINIGFTSATAQLQAQARGVPSKIIVQVRSRDDFFIYVLSQSPRKEPKDLKGARIGVSRFGGSEHAFGRSLANVLGLEGKVRFVSTGGIVESIASLKTATIDALILTPAQMLSLIVSGQVRTLVSIADYHPKEWTSTVVFARKDFIEASRDTVRRAARAIVAGLNYTDKNPAWAMAKMKGEGGYDDAGAKIMFDTLQLVADGKINRKGLENVRNFLLEYGILPRDKAPSLEEAYTAEFTP